MLARRIYYCGFEANLEGYQSRLIIQFHYNTFLGAQGLQDDYSSMTGVRNAEQRLRGSPGLYGLTGYIR